MIRLSKDSIIGWLNMVCVGCRDGWIVGCLDGWIFGWFKGLMVGCWMVELLNYLERWRLEVCMVERLNVGISA